eukprot:m.36508 g.36508  ORF g.36508 m.36508 type:complete len:555 (+) comp9129_c0_seq2:144-1808(+)
MSGSFSVVFEKKQPPSSNPEAAGTPCGRSGHVAVLDDKEENMYVYGGYNVDSRQEYSFKELWRFHIPSSSWQYIKTSNDGPGVTCSCSAVMIGTKILVFGGTGVPFGHVVLNQIFVCDLYKKVPTWKLLKPSGIPPSPRFGASLTLDQENNCFYLVGGTSGHYFFIDVFKYDLNKNSWTKLSSDSDPRTPRARYQHECVLMGGKLYLFGGGWPNISSNETMIDIPVFDLSRKCWTIQETSSDPTRNTHPEERRSHSVVRVGDAAYVFGGTSTGHNVFGEVWYLDLLDFTWHFEPEIWKTPLNFQQHVKTKDQILFFGGKTRDEVRSNSVISYPCKIKPRPRLQTKVNLPLRKLSSGLKPLEGHVTIHRETPDVDMDALIKRLDAMPKLAYNEDTEYDIVITYRTDVEKGDGLGMKLCEALAAELSSAGHTPFHGRMVPGGDNWQQIWFGEMGLSKVAIVMFSELYFQSDACTKEIIKICQHPKLSECVIPVFVGKFDINSDFLGSSKPQRRDAAFIRTIISGNCVPPPDKGLFQDNWDDNVALLKERVNQLKST